MEDDVLQALMEVSEAASSTELVETTSMVANDTAVATLANAPANTVLSADDLARLNEILDSATSSVGNVADLSTPPAMNAGVQADLDQVLAQRVESVANENPSVRNIFTAARNQASKIGDQITSIWDNLSRPTKFLIKNGGLISVTFGIGYALEQAIAKKAHDTGHRQSLSSYLVAGEANYKKLGLPYDREVAATAALQYPWIDTTC